MNKKDLKSQVLRGENEFNVFVNLDVLKNLHKLAHLKLSNYISFV